MTSINDISGDRAARAQAVRQSRAIRVRKIRRRVIGSGLALFVAAWLLMTIVLVSGHDPALAARKTSTASSSTSATAPTTTSAAAPASTTSGTVSPVTTRQS